MEVEEQTSRDHELISAAYQNDVSAIRELLAARCAVSWANEAGQTPLHIACLWGHLEAARALVEARADVSVVNQLGTNTPLHLLAIHAEKNYENRAAMAELLLQAGADASSANVDGNTPADLTDDDALRTALGVAPRLLHSAVRRLDAQAVADVLCRASSGELPAGMLDSMNWHSGVTPLHLAVGAPSTACTSLLVEARASVNIRTRDTWQSPLHLAVACGSFFVTEQIIQAGADVNQYDPDQDHDWDMASSTFSHDPQRHFTPLHICSGYGNIPVMRVLLEARAQVDAKDSFDRTPLHLCIAAARDEDLGPGVGIRVKNMVKRPERNGKLGAIIGPLEVEDNGCEAATSESGCGDPRCGWYPVLVEDGPPEGILLKPEKLDTVFDEAVDLLLAARADVNLGNREIGMDSSVLHWATHNGDIALVRKAIASGALVNKQRKSSGLTPLHLAIRGRQPELINLLIQAHGDMTLAAGGKTVLDLAAINKLEFHASSGVFRPITL